MLFIFIQTNTNNFHYCGKYYQLILSITSFNFVIIVFKFEYWGIDNVNFSEIIRIFSLSINGKELAVDFCTIKGAGNL